MKIELLNFIRDRRSFLWLTIGTLLMVFANGTWSQAFNSTLLNTEDSDW